MVGRGTSVERCATRWQTRLPPRVTSMDGESAVDAARIRAA